MDRVWERPSTSPGREYLVASRSLLSLTIFFTSQLHQASSHFVASLAFHRLLHVGCRPSLRRRSLLAYPHQREWALSRTSACGEADLFRSQAFGKYTRPQVQLLTVPYYVFACIYVVCIAYYSDKLQRRFPFVFA